MTHTPYWKLYRLAPRAISVIETHGPSEPAIQSYASTLIPAAHAIVEAYKRVRTFAGSRAIELAEARTAAGHLIGRIRAWTSVVDKTLDGFDVRSFGARPDVPEDVIHDAEDLIALVEEKASEADFVAALKDDLEAAIEAARKEWSEANTAGSEQVTLQRELKAAAEAFNRELIAFRKTLAALLGRNHRDYRRLRVSTVKSTDGDEEELEDEDEDVGEMEAGGDTGASEPVADGASAKKEDEEAAE